MPEIPESDRYQTLAEPVSGVYKEKGSKFLSFAYPVSTEEQIKDHLLEIKKAYADATHHCYAYRLGVDGTTWRANDDGEPTSTAGKPILGQLRSYQISDTLIIIVRYFGGVKLGVSGLINAYRQAAANALQKSKIIIKYAQTSATLRFPYLYMDAVMKLLKDFKASITAQQGDEECELSFSIRRSLFPALSEKLYRIDPFMITP